MKGHNRQCGFSSKLTTEIKSVEAEVVDAGEMLLMLLNVVMNCVETRGTTLQRLRVRL